MADFSRVAQLAAGTDSESQLEAGQEAVQRRGWRTPVTAVTLCAVLALAVLSGSTAAAPHAKVTPKSSFVSAQDDSGEAAGDNATDQAGSAGEACHVQAAGSSCSVESAEACAAGLVEQMGEDVAKMMTEVFKDDHSITVRFKFAVTDAAVLEALSEDDTWLGSVKGELTETAMVVLGEVSSKSDTLTASFIDSAMQIEDKFVFEDPDTVKTAWAACCGAAEAAAAMAAKLPVEGATVTGVSCQKNPVGW